MNSQAGHEKQRNDVHGASEYQTAPSKEKKRIAQIVGSPSRSSNAPPDGCEQPHRDESKQGPQPSGKSQSTVPMHPRSSMNEKRNDALYAA